MARKDDEQTEDGQIDYEKDISINKHRLDREFVTHAKKHMKYAELAARASAAAARAHEKVKVIRSEIITEILAEGGKPTAQVIEARYRTDKRHKEAKEELIRAEETAQLLNEAVLAFRARKMSLENLARLHVSGYYSDPEAPEGSGMGDAAATAERTVRKKMDKGD